MKILEKLDIETIDKRISELKFIKSRIQYFINKEHRSVEELILIKYIEYQSVTDVANYMNKCGNRIDGRKYTHNDISKMLKDEHICGSELFKTAQSMFKYNKSKCTFKALIKLLKG